MTSVLFALLLATATASGSSFAPIIPTELESRVTVYTWKDGVLSQTEFYKGLNILQRISLSHSLYYESTEIGSVLKFEMTYGAPKGAVYEVGDPKSTDKSCKKYPGQPGQGSFNAALFRQYYWSDRFQGGEYTGLQHAPWENGGATYHTSVKILGWQNVTYFYAQDSLKLRYIAVSHSDYYSVGDYGQEGLVERQFGAKDFWLQLCPEFNSEISAAWESQGKGKTQGLGQRVADAVMDLAFAKSQGKCALNVRIAVQRAQNLPEAKTGIVSAKDYGPWLLTKGYLLAGARAEDAKVGDIAVMESSKGHPHGHIQVKTGKSQWTSDFVQRNFYPYKDGSRPGYAIYTPDE